MVRSEGEEKGAACRLKDRSEESELVFAEEMLRDGLANLRKSEGKIIFFIH